MHANKDIGHTYTHAHIRTNTHAFTHSQVWVTVSVDDHSGLLTFGGGSDSELSAGVVSVLSEALSGLSPEEVLQVGTWGLHIEQRAK
jgi:sulfur transfer protein SufE